MMEQKSFNPIIIVAVVVVVALAGIFVMSSQGRNAAIPEQPQSMEAIEGAMNEPKTITIEASNFKFDLSEIRVKQGDTVKVVFNNKEGVHDFVIDEFNVRTKQISGEGTDTVEFVADKAGTYEYYCSVGQHRQMGMKGNLIVE